jgi:16S rRNA (cytosine967-C5)-methyltransferase
MHNKGLIIAMDKEAKKLQELERRAQRAGVNIIQTKLASQQTLEQLHASADRLLLDVPCSGLGVLRRNPDAKWKLNLDFINEIIKVQAQILKEYSTMLKPGGLMVYATCSILPIENQLQIAKFIAQNSDTFQLIAEQSIMPSQGYDGFYMAALKKL